MNPVWFIAFLILVMSMAIQNTGVEESKNSFVQQDYDYLNILFVDFVKGVVDSARKENHPDGYIMRCMNCQSNDLDLDYKILDFATRDGIEKICGNNCGYIGKVTNGKVESMYIFVDPTGTAWVDRSKFLAAAHKIKYIQYLRQYKKDYMSVTDESLRFLMNQIPDGAFIIQATL